MAHYAKVVDGTVTQVIVAEQEFVDTLPDKDNWVQTSYNTRGGKHYNPDEPGIQDAGIPLRKNFAGIGYTYDKDIDAFYEPQPYSNWILNETTCVWEPPIPYPSDGKGYRWDQSSTSWKINTNNPLQPGSE